LGDGCSGTASSNRRVVAHLELLKSTGRLVPRTENVFPEAHWFVRRLIRFALLPYCYLKLVNWRLCTKSKAAVLFDFIYIFFVLRDFPDNYGPCRLWERPRREWALYFGSNYNPHQKALLRRRVNPLPLQIVYTDKHACDLLCRGVGLPVPRFFGTLEAGESVEDRVGELLDHVGAGEAMIKPIYGHAGIGVIRASREGNALVLSRGRESLPASGVRMPEKCIVQEVVKQDPKISVFAPLSLNTVRVLTMLDLAGDAFLLAASMRFGRGDSVVDNWSAGGVAVGVDIRSGQLREVAYDKSGNGYTAHPSQGLSFGGVQVPRWSEIVRLALRVQQELPFNRMLGLDVAIGVDGVVLIEINPDADIMFQEQTSGPLFSHRRTWEVFRDYGLLYNRPQMNLFQE